MMTPRSKKTSSTQVQTRTSLTPLEEKVVRMRKGLKAPPGLVLAQIGQDDPVIAAKLREIEERALAAVAARKSPAKRKIVGALRRKGS